MAELKAQVTKFLAQGLITPSSSPYGAPVLFIPKPDGSLRFCLDYRALNKITAKLRYPLPRIDDLLDSARGSQFFSALDLAGGYYQIRIAEEDVPKTAFCTPFGHYEWRVLPMGLSNAPSTFVQAMNSVFEKYIGDFVLVYLDDILIMSRTPEDHLEHLRVVFSTLREHNFQVKLSKCKFFKEQIKYLGHILSKEGVRPNPAKGSKSCKIGLFPPMPLKSNNSWAWLTISASSYPTSHAWQHPFMPCAKGAHEGVSAHAMPPPPRPPPLFLRGKGPS
jgi:hypothetical protein